MTCKIHKNPLYLPSGKEEMDYFYKPENKILSNLVEKLNPSFEQLPVRKDYHVAKFKV